MSQLEDMEERGGADLCGVVVDGLGCVERAARNGRGLLGDVPREVVPCAVRDILHEHRSVLWSVRGVIHIRHHVPAPTKQERKKTGAARGDGHHFQACTAPTQQVVTQLGLRCRLDANPVGHI